MSDVLCPFESLSLPGSAPERLEQRVAHAPGISVRARLGLTALLRQVRELQLLPTFYGHRPVNASSKHDVYVSMACPKPEPK